MQTPFADQLAAAVATELSDPKRLAWFRTACRHAGQLDAHARFVADFAGAGRRLGDAAVRGLPATIRTDAWPASQAGRIALLRCRLDALAPAEHVGCVEDLYYRGALGERQAVLAALAYLPSPSQYLALAVDAARCNAVPEFAALARHNPYPARYFGDAALGQLVLKAISMGVLLPDMTDLATRTTPELRGRVCAAVSERRAAGRAIRPDVAAFVDD
ncbi:MAG: hypothetical protein B7733_04200 [Myxococcales bacterium FL481]|nr:MAG: hypothetical protein B7733_04200 [Myxococcales bacterium FL481]